MRNRERQAPQQPGTLLSLGDVEVLGVRVLRQRRVAWERRRQIVATCTPGVPLAGLCLALFFAGNDDQMALLLALGTLVLTGVLGAAVVAAEYLAYRPTTDSRVLRAGLRACGGVGRLDASAYRYFPQLPRWMQETLRAHTRLDGPGEEVAQVLACDGFDGSLRDLAQTSRGLSR